MIQKSSLPENLRSVSMVLSSDKLEGLDFNSIKGITLDLCKRIDTDSCPKDPATTRKPNSTVEQLRQSHWGSGSQVFGSVRPLRAVTLRL
jgi:hypothetical protein